MVSCVSIAPVAILLVLVLEHTGFTAELTIHDKFCPKHLHYIWQSVTRNMEEASRLFHHHFSMSYNLWHMMSSAIVAYHLLLACKQWQSQ